jgi:outer membrane protein TolC
VPTNTFSFTQDDMTMIAVGLEQSFPKGHSLAIKSKQTQALAMAEQRKAQEKIATLLQNVRKTWLDLYYWERAARVIRRNRTLFTYLLKTTRSQYSVGQNNLSNVLQVQLELSRLNDQLAQIQQQIDVLRAELGRWVGQEQANRPLASSLPQWKNPPPFNTMKTCLEQHPLLKIDAANIDAAHDEVALAREQFKPGFTADVSYGIRQGNMIGMNGLPRSRSDMITAQVAMDLPVFAKNRQSRRLQASTHQLEATELDQQVHYRDLLKELTAQYAIWQSLSQRENLYTQQLMPEARQNAKAALLGYRSATADLATVLRAYTNEKNIQLEALQIKIEREKVRAALLYLEGLSR